MVGRGRAWHRVTGASNAIALWAGIEAVVEQLHGGGVPPSALLVSDSPQREAILRTLSNALAESTAESYGGHVSRFIEFCATQRDRPSPLPATTDTVMRWLSVITADGRVKKDSLQPYLSTVNCIHRDMGFDEPAIGHLIQTFKSGLGHEQTAAGRGAERVYLPPPVVERILLWALELELASAALQRQLEFRAAVAVVFTYCFFARGATSSALQAKHVRRGPDGELLVTLALEKGKQQRARARLLTIPAGSIRGLDELLAKWESFAAKLEKMIRTTLCRLSCGEKARGAVLRAWPLRLRNSTLGSS